MNLAQKLESWLQLVVANVRESVFSLQFFSTSVLLVTQEIEKIDIRQELKG